MSASTAAPPAPGPAPSPSPVHVDADLDPHLSRWQWLVKWLLALPHYVVLAFLWIAFTVLSVAAFVAILVTGRYPRSLFDFNVGVLRWTWRVAFYTYGALGTDQYPPFSLSERPDYPAHLEIDYPDHLSRGLVLVKTWLLAIPHYVVLALFLGGTGVAVSGAGEAAGEVWPYSWGLLGVLVAVAAVVLLVTGSYPPALFDLVLGLNRWALRVAAYAALMTDRYPPFRLDQGGHDPGTHVLDDRPAQGAAQEVPPRPGGPSAGTRWTVGPVLGVVVGSVMVMGSLALAGAGVAGAVAGATMRDDDGFVMAGDEQLLTTSYALTSSRLVLQVDGSSDVVDAVLGDVKVTASPGGADALFLGLGPADEVDDYLAGVRHDTVDDLVGPDYVTSDGGPPPAPPGDQDFWVASSVGAGQQTVTWEPRDGEWAVVVMNADGGAGVRTTVTAGAELPALTWLVAAALVGGGLGVLLGAVVVALSVHAARR